MKNDLYLKMVLTVIALCLLVNVFRDVDIIPKLNAANPDQGFEKNYVRMPVNPDGSINVRIISGGETMKVELDRVNCEVPIKQNYGNVLDIRLKDVNYSAFSSVFVPVKLAGSDPMKVKIEDVSWNAFSNSNLEVKIK